MAGTTANNLTELTTGLDNTNDEVIVYDDSAAQLKKMTPDNFRDGLLAGSALTTVDDTTLTASRAVESNANGQLSASTVTATELGYVSGVTSAIQTQINATYEKNLLYNSNFDFGTRAQAGQSPMIPTLPPVG